MLKPKDVLLKWHEAFNHADADAIADLYSEDAVNHQVANEPVVGKTAIHEMFKEEFSAAEMVCIIENIFEDGEWAIKDAQFTLRRSAVMEKFFALSEEKQTTIRNAALACFAKHGYEKASINDIASAAGISKASMFQYFGSKPALYEYLLNYCVSQMKKAYDLKALDADEDFFDRVWKACVMKVENLKKFPHVAAFITSAATEPAEEVKTFLQTTLWDGKGFTEMLVLHQEDCVKFKRPEDAKLVFQMLILLGYGIASRCESGMDFGNDMSELENILEMLKQNFYKEEYL